MLENIAAAAMKIIRPVVNMYDFVKEKVTGIVTLIKNDQKQECFSIIVPPKHGILFTKIAVA